MIDPEDLPTPTEADDDNLHKAYEEAADDDERPTPGRPEIGGAALIRFGDLLPRIDERARAQYIRRPEFVRRAVSAYLDPVEPTIDAVQKHLRANFTTVLTTFGTQAPTSELYRTPEEARQALDQWANSFTRDGRGEIVARSDRHLVVTLTGGLVMTCAIVEAAPVQGGSGTWVNQGEANLCRQLGLDPDELWATATEYRKSFTR